MKTCCWTPLRFMLSVLTFCAMACHSEEMPEQAPPASGAVSAPFDVGAVMRQVHFAYTPESQGWRGGHSTYAVRASAEGLTLTTAKPAGSARAHAPAREEATLELGRALLMRGERALGGPTSEGRVEKDGHLALAREDGIVEHLRNAEEGVEQSWTFQRAPEGQGNLRVRIPLAGLSFSGATASGLHFADARSGLGFRYGQVTWVDATGRRTELKATYEASHLLLSVPQELVEASTYPASLAPVISPELGTDEPVVTPAPGNQVQPAVASDGMDYLVIWQDYRLGDNVSRIYGTRVTPMGILVDPSGLRIGTASGTGRHESPAVAYNGREYLVVWADFTDDLNANILGARVSTRGSVVDSTPLAISTAGGHQTSPAVVAGMDNWFVVWEDARGAESMDIYGARVMQDGQVADPEGIAIGTGAAAQRHPAVTFNDTSWLTVWMDEGSDSTGDIRGARVSTEGVVLDSPALVIAAAAGAQRSPRVASRYGSSLVVWEDSRQGSDTDIYGARVTQQGVVLDASALVISSAPNSQYAPVVAASPNEFLVVWEELGSGEWNLQGTRVMYDGSVQAPAIVVSAAAGTQSSPAVATNGNEFLVVWSNQRMGDPETDIQGALVRMGSVSPPVELSLDEGSASAANEGNVKVASNGADYLLVWEPQRSSTAHICAARVSSTGEVLDPSGITLSSAGSWQRTPAVASDGVDWLVVWVDDRSGDLPDIYGTRVSSTGEVLDPLGVAIRATAASESAPAVASNGNGYLVVWSAPGSDGSMDVLGARVTSQGQVLDTSALSVAIAPRGQAAPQVASNGADYLVVWVDGRQGIHPDIYGTRVTAGGAVLEASGLIINAAPGSQYMPVLASNGDGWLVVWAHVGSRYEMRGTRVTSAGQVLDTSGFAIGFRTQSQSYPAVASDGLDYLVVWNESSGGQADVYGARVSAMGQVLDSTGFPLSNASYGEAHPSIASAGPSGYLVAYSRVEDGKPQRTRARLVSFGQPVSVSLATMSSR
ncbi:hypothetical protein [Archangium lansingense]|uniref:Lipoprotein n=1 Tax=Archangium lansingense TaxID=2995310 RepID=A0ABT4A275_9BACT|nr:hypothetical protein [Archangium lansinium]MCY1075747.1 hypothetical protein [Archangium lansinium]